MIQGEVLVRTHGIVIYCSRAEEREHHVVLSEPGGAPAAPREQGDRSTATAREARVKERD